MIPRSLAACLPQTEAANSNFWKQQDVQSRWKHVQINVRLSKKSENKP